MHETFTCILVIPNVNDCFTAFAYSLELPVYIFLRMQRTGYTASTCN